MSYMYVILLWVGKWVKNILVCLLVEKKHSVIIRNISVKWNLIINNKDVLITNENYPEIYIECTRDVWR